MVTILKIALIFILGVLLSLPLTSLFAVVEVNGNFGYSKEVFGETKSNSYVERTYSGSMAFYFLYYTGIEVNYSYKQDIMTQNEDVNLGGGVSILSKQGVTKTRTYGVGLRQGLTSKNAFISPMISAGYAKQFKSGGDSYDVDDNGFARHFYFPYKSNTNDVVFGKFILRIRLTQLFSLTGSVKTTFKAFEFSEAKNSLEYEAGFSWYL